MNCCNFICKTPPSPSPPPIPPPPPTLHPNFKSLNPNINNFEILNHFLKYPLERRPIFTINTTPSEEKIWDKKELQSFKIIPEKIDRIYYINIEVTRFSREIIYYLLARQDYKGCKLYIEMICVFKHFHRPSQCRIFISFKRNLFMKLVSYYLPTSIKTSIYQFIEKEEDGFCMEKFDKTFIKVFWSRKIVYTTVPLLKDLCMDIVGLKVDTRYWEILPKTLKNDLDDRDAFKLYMQYSTHKSWHIYYNIRKFSNLNVENEIRIPIRRPFPGDTKCILI